MSIKTVPKSPYSSDLATCDFWLFPKLTGWRYETIEEMKEAVTKVIDTLTKEDFHGAFQELLERYNKCIAARGDYFEGDSSFMCVLSIKVPIRKKSWYLFKDSRRANTSLKKQTISRKILFAWNLTQLNGCNAVFKKLYFWTNKKIRMICYSRNVLKGFGQKFDILFLVSVCFRNSRVINLSYVINNWENGFIKMRKTEM